MRNFHFVSILEAPVDKELSAFHPQSRDPPSLRMEPGPSRLLPVLLTGFLSLWLCARGQSSYTIDTVGLTVLPGSTVQSGTPVTLRCQVSVSHDNIPDLTHTFLITRDDIPVHTSTTTEDSVEYELNPARAADSGSYECRVTVKGKNKASFSQKLDVTGLQTPVLYLNKTKPYENEEFTATCSAPEEKGPLSFRFFQRSRDGHSKKIKQPAPSWNSSETMLVLRAVGDSILYCDYEINLVSESRRSNSSNEVQVIVRGLYISPTVNVLPSSTVYEGDILEVVCRVKSELKNIEVFLTKDRKILMQAPVSLSHRFTAQESDSGELVCKAEWGNVQKETYLSITVKELFSTPTLTLDPVDLFEGDRFKLSCSVSINAPERITNQSVMYSFYKDNFKLTSGETFISVAHPQKNGNYTCKAQAASHTRSFVKESKKLVVKAKVPVSKPTLSVVGGTLVLGKPFQLICHSDKGTLPIDFTLNGPKRLPEGKAVRKPGEQAVFDCAAIYKQTDLNNFICHAKNSQKRPAEVGLGQQLLRTTNIIEPVSDPVLTMLPSSGDVSEGQDLTLSCSVQRGTPPVSFTWYHIGREAPLGFQVPKKLEGSFRIKNVKGEDRGGYFCESSNPANETKRSRTVTIGVKMAGWKKGLIGVFCLLLLLALILVVVFRKRLIHFKRKRTAELSVKSAGTKVERLSLTQAEVNQAANVTPGIMGKNVWSERESVSESDDQNSVTSPEKQEPRYTEVPTREEDPEKAPVEKVTNTLNNAVRNSTQGVPEQTDSQGSVEYAQLNHDANHHSDHANHDEHSVQDEHTDAPDSSSENTDAPTPDS
ncbi:platelet endothelial cell adhesion molecule [Notolabrus celidotus]|uniref:platelet endothelial cell adhesion molecule n=1 Tax=Notolabrus celidotus TaxID=1203425 RepID=UPI00149085CB|nr:platelet endothelial cell adhesion molecule [Notolabrus celidotus]